MNAVSPPKNGWRIFFAPSILGAIVLFLALWFLDFPKPTYDDLFQAGAALNLASGGDYSNPYIARQEFPSHFFFEYPPLQSHALGGWLWLFGIHTSSMTAYLLLCHLVTTVATISLLRRHRAAPVLEWMVPLGVFFSLVNLGIRPEPLSIAMTMTGFALCDADATKARGAFQFTGLLLMMLAASAAPRMALFIGALIVCAAWRVSNSGEIGARGKAAFWSLGAATITGLLFLWMIHFRVSEFAETFHYHAAGRLYKDRWHQICQYLTEYLGWLQMPLVIVPLVLVVCAFKKPKDGLKTPALFICCSIPPVLWTGSLGSPTVWWAILAMVLLACGLMKSFSHSLALFLQVVIVVLLLEVNRKNFSQCWGIVSGNISPEMGAEAATAAAMRPTPDHPLLVDAWVARYLYDYHLPEGTLDAEWCVKFPGAGPGTYPILGDGYQQLRDGDVFVICGYMRTCLERYTLLDHVDRPFWKPFGIKPLGFDSHPREISILKSESCKGIRTNAPSSLPGT